jgi:hypothetical protein
MTRAWPTAAACSLTVSPRDERGWFVNKALIRPVVNAHGCADQGGRPHGATSLTNQCAARLLVLSCAAPAMQCLHRGIAPLVFSPGANMQTPPRCHTARMRSRLLGQRMSFRARHPLGRLELQPWTSPSLDQRADARKTPPLRHAQSRLARVPCGDGGPRTSQAIDKQFDRTQLMTVPVGSNPGASPVRLPARAAFLRARSQSAAHGCDHARAFPQVRYEPDVTLQGVARFAARPASQSRHLRARIGRPH